MPNPVTQSLNSLINIVVLMQPGAAPIPTFNQALFIGTTSHISNATRLMKFDAHFATEMATAGFGTTDPEYIAMNMYMSASPQPQYGWVGRQDTTAIQTAIPHAGSGGTNYKVGDIIGVTQGGASGGQLLVSTINAGTGAVTGLTINPGFQGTAYSVAGGLVTTGGSGTGLTVDITAIGETPLQALTACRAASSSWYAAMVCADVDADVEAIGAYIQTAQPTSCFLYTTSDANVLNGVANNVGLFLKNLAYNRILGQYATTQAGAYPNNIYATAAIMGYAMGQNTGLANSAYTLLGKSEVGVSTEPLTLTQIGNIQAANINVYLSYNSFYNWFIDGRMADGSWFDTRINVDMLTAQLQLAVADL